MAPDEIKRELHDVVKRLFADAGVTFERVSKRGQPYSVADEAYTNTLVGSIIREIEPSLLGEM